MLRRFAVGLSFLSVCGCIKGQFDVKKTSCAEGKKAGPDGRCQTIESATTISSTASTAPTAAQLALAPLENNISTDHALDFATSLPIMTSTANIKTFSTPTAISSSLFAVSGPPALINVTQTPSSPGAASMVSTTLSTKLVTDPTQSFTANISVATTFPSNVAAAQQACSTQSPFASIACSLQGFKISSASLTSGILQTKAYTKNGATSDYKLSNQITANKYVLQQVSNTSASATTADNAQQIRSVGNKVFIVGNDPTAATKLYMADGSTMGQFMNSNPGSNDSVASVMVANGRFYYNASVPGPLSKLFSTDGTSIRQETNTNAGSNDGSGMSSLLNGDLPTINGRVFISSVVSPGNTKLVSINGSDQKQHSDIVPGGNDAVQIQGIVNNRVIFLASPTGPTTKLYSTDGTSITQLSNLIAGGNDGFSNPVVLNGRMFFDASYVVSGRRKLVSTNGTDLRLHTDFIVGGTDGIAITDSTLANGRIFFTASISGVQQKLFSTNGSDMKQHTNFNPGASDNILGLVALGSRVYFVADTAGKTKLYSTNGSDLLQHTNFNAATDSIGILGRTSERVYFEARPSGLKKLFSTDGTDLRQHTDLNPGGSDAIVSAFYSTRSPLFLFAVTLAGPVYKWYASNGTTTWKVTDFGDNTTTEVDVPYNCIDNPVEFTDAGDVYFTIYTDYNTCVDKIFRLCRSGLNGCP